MKCFQCGKGKMVSKLADMTAHVRGEAVPVRTEATVCDRCGFQILSDEQSAVYTIASADAYRERHKLLTTKELKEMRRGLGMSFRAFAKYLKVGEASLKRWEAGLVQDEAMDELIRLKVDLPTARNNVRQLESRLGPGLASASPVAHVIVVQVPRREATESTWRTPSDSISSRRARFMPKFLKDTCYPA
ncbi:MAG: type II toxin-antitoxin system MqsA family antitoxin [Bryobacterales bacterium]|nr:type II toxin-antitoxin system MqsA family antitoxin [Bryobacterales bacterium]